MGNKLSDIFGPTPGCLPLDELVKTLEGARGGDVKRASEQHIKTCPNCSAEIDLLRSFESATATPEERDAVSAIVSRLRKSSPAAVESWWARIWRPRILAPAAISLAAAAVLIVVGVRPRQSNLEAPVDTVMRSNHITPVAPLGELTERPSQLQWQSLAAASRYNIRLLEVDRTELWRAATQSTSVVIPASVLVKIVPSKKLLWEVSAVDSSGNLLASSGINSFVVLK